MVPFGAGAELPIAQVSDMSLRLSFFAAGLGLTLVPASVAEANSEGASSRSPLARLFLGIALDRIGKCRTICDSYL